MELALLCLCVEAVLQKPLEDVGDVFLQCLREYQDVVQVHEDVLVDDVMEDVIHEGLEDRVRQLEWHHQVLVVSPRRVKRGLPLISFPYPDQVVSILEV